MTFYVMKRRDGRWDVTQFGDFDSAYQYFAEWTNAKLVQVIAEK